MRFIPRKHPRKHPAAALTLSGDYCGCATSARFLGVALIASIGYFAWHGREYSVARAGVRILIFAFAGAILGKLVGIAAYQLRGRLARGVTSRRADSGAFPFFDSPY